ncbi:zinc-dependent alcohol dehydrogenase [Candidatus Amarolinea aalborgensis]|uniref:zinc-dependent alcohol dehydrogenase n=1 Tax=Candidatus Amarolinea aalborgensis TaxID=2249329 RepID=UPI003BF9A6CE
MQTMVVDMDVSKIALTRVLSRLTPAAYFAPTAPLRLLTLPDPPLPQPDWVRVRNRLCGICGSDLHQIFLDASLDVAPVALPSHRRIYLGHEMVGDVIEAGPAQTAWRPGDRVVRWGRADDCAARGLADRCPACARGHRVLCMRASEPRSHHPIGGGFGDTFITPASTLVRVPDAVRDEQAIFTEPAAVAIHAAWRCLPQPGQHVLVLGVGTIGFLLIQVLRAVQAQAKISAVAEFPWQADLARACGVDHVFLAHADGYAEAAALTGARLYHGRGGNRMLMGGFDTVFDVVGIPATLTNALRWTQARGTVVLVGVNLHRMRVDLTPVWHQEVNLLGAVGHDIVVWQGEEISTFELALRWMQSGRLRTDPLLTHRFPLHAFRQAFATAVDKRQARSIKVAFEELATAAP